MTFCPRLWNEIYIDEKGNVFSCCHSKPTAFGNIHKQKLKEICNNKAIKDLRQKSLNGQLHCFHSCKLLDKNRIGSFSKNTLTISYDQLKRIKILFGEACNLNCIMCVQDSKSKTSLDYKILINNVDIIPFERIELQGGEPLFIESCKKYFDYLISKGKKASFLTNGMLINDAWAEKIALHSNFIYFSLNAATKETHELINRGSKFEVVLRNIKRIRYFKEKHKTNINIHGHMTIIIENLKEIPLFIEKFIELGFERISFSYDRKVPLYLRFHPFKKIKLKWKIGNLLNKLKHKNNINLLRLRLLDLV